MSILGVSMLSHVTFSAGLHRPYTRLEGQAGNRAEIGGFRRWLNKGNRAEIGGFRRWLNKGNRAEIGGFRRWLKRGIELK